MRAPWIWLPCGLDFYRQLRFQASLPEWENKAAKSIAGVIPWLGRDAVLLMLYNHVLMFSEVLSSSFRFTSFLVQTANICAILSSLTKRQPKRKHWSLSQWQSLREQGTSDRIHLKS